MDAYGIAFSTLFGGMAVAFANATALQSAEVRRERYVRHGVFKGADTPNADASAGFITREASRERQAIVGSAVLTLAGVVVLAVVGAPTVQAIAFVVMTAAFLGRGIVIAVLTAREALRERAPGPRVSHGGVRGIGAQLNRVPFVLIGAAQLVFLALYVPQSLALRPDVSGWVLTFAIASVVASVAAWALAAWVARQPQLAADATELAWSDAARRRDLAAILLTGPVLAFGVAISAFSYGGGGPMGDPVGALPGFTFGYLGFAIMLAIGVAIVGHRTRTAAQAAPC